MFEKTDEQHVGARMKARTRRLSLLEGVAAGVFFGTASIFIRYLPSLDSISIAFWRLIVAAMALTTILAVLRRHSGFAFLHGRLRDLFILGVFLALHFIFFISAVKDTTILNATVFVNTTPIFSMFVSAFIFKLKPSRLAVGGVAISFVGILVIAYAETLGFGGNSASIVSSPSVKGDLEAMAAAIVEAFYLNYGRRVRARSDILGIMLPIYAFAAVAVGLLSFPLMFSAPTLPMGLVSIVSILALGLIPTATAHTLYFSSLSNLKSFETATMALLEPIGATLLGVALFSEYPAFPFVAGAVLILLGIILVVRNPE